MQNYPASAIFCMTMYGEGRSEGVEGLILIGRTIINRANSNRWPDTIKAVCLQPKQFSCWNDPEHPNTLKMLSAWEDRCSDADMEQVMWVRNGIIHGHILSNFIYESVNHYHTISIEPYWAKNKLPLVIHKNHSFYDL